MSHELPWVTCIIEVYWSRPFPTNWSESLPGSPQWWDAPAKQRQLCLGRNSQNSRNIENQNDPNHDPTGHCHGHNLLRYSLQRRRWKRRASQRPPHAKCPDGWPPDLNEVSTSLNESHVTHHWMSGSTKWFLGKAPWVAIHKMGVRTVPSVHATWTIWASHLGLCSKLCNKKQIAYVVYLCSEFLQIDLQQKDNWFCPSLKHQNIQKRVS